MPRRSKERGFWHWERFAHRWITLLVACTVCAFGAFPIYWNYKCRFYGVLCERAFTEPSAGTLSSNTEAVGIQLTKGRDQKDLQGFELSPRKSWFQSPRVDVAVRCKEERTIVIDSLRVSDLESISLFSQPESRVAIASYSSVETVVADRKKAAAHVFFYALDSFLAKREFSMECVESRFLDPSIRATNIIYDKTKNHIVLDILSSCDHIVVHGQRVIRARPPDAGDYKYHLTRSESVIVEFGPNYQIKSIVALSENRAAEQLREQERKRDAEIVACQDNLPKNDTQERRMKICQVYVPGPSLGDRGRGYYRIYELGAGQVRELATGSCYGGIDLAEPGPSETYVAITCGYVHDDNKAPENSYVHYRVLIFFLGSEAPLAFTVECACKDLDILDFRVNEKENEISFETLTDGGAPQDLRQAN